MKPERLAEIRARCEAATEGPWRVHGVDKHWDKHQAYYKVRGSIPGRKWQIADCRYVDHEEGCYDEGEAAANANFIARARQDIPDLLAEVEALRAVFITSKCPACGIAWSADECEDMRGAGVASCLCGYRAALSGKEKP